MAEIKWTDAQKSAIETKNKNILVSAAAGSGKTAVLVERIINRITDKENPADISSFVVITFTRAAAAQMRSKINAQLRKRLAEEPDNAHLKAQLIRLSGARICTIDSLCSDIVRENFQDAGCDTSLRTADEAELKMLMSDVLSEVLEEHFKNPSPGFIDLINYYTDKSDSRAEEIILSLYKFSQSHPEPGKWISGCAAAYEQAGGQEDQSAWINWLGSYVNTVIAAIDKMADEGLRVCEEPCGPGPYAVQFEKYKILVKDLAAPDTPFDEKGFLIRSFLADKGRLPGAKKGTDEALKEYAKYLNNAIKDEFEELGKTVFTDDYPVLSDDMKKCAAVASEICALTEEFSARYAQAKAERRITDFNDIEHNALKVLIKKDERGALIKNAGGYVPSGVADRMAREISEIIVDEYQDTNELQDAILFALSSERFGRPNVFLVGDVKQSIYGFRMARPELFTEKYNSYAAEGDTCERIILSENFRSRRQIIDIVNSVFERVMIPDVGGIDYCDGGRMVCGAGEMYPEDSSADFTPEIIFVNETGAAGKSGEGTAIGLKIKKLMECGMVTDKETGLLRGMRYDDIVILVRNSDNPEILKSLKAMDIPVLSSSGRGFFDTFEVRLTLDLLGIIDNPLQDIPFTAVLTSPLVGLSSDDLAKIKISMGGESLSMYEACSRYDAKDELAVRLKAFLKKLSAYRKAAVYMGVYELVDFVLDDSLLPEIFAAMPGGEGRIDNIEFLKAKVGEFAGSSYPGLFDLIRYIEQLKGAEQDFGNAGDASGVCAVRMTTIHRSKGLEFPVVFIAGAGRHFNDADRRQSIIPDRDLGFGMELRDPQERTLKSTLLMQTVKLKKKLDLCAEEMRLLYVAMTRAKEKLIITASGKISKNAALKWSFCCSAHRGDICAVKGLSSYQALISASLSNRQEADALHRLAGLLSETPEGRDEELFTLSVTAPPVTEVVSEREAVRDSLIKETILSAAEAAPVSESGTYIYPFAAATQTPVKITASKLEEHAYTNEEQPVFKIKRGALSAAGRGTAYHTLFEKLDYDMFKENSAHEAALQIEKLEKAGFLNSQEAAALEPEKIAAFLCSGIGRRMKAAAFSGRLVREQQFIMAFDDNGEQRILQGIIDAFFEEDGGIVLVDYKTDRSKTDAEFIKTYKPQQDAYRAAIEASLGQPVREQIIYSVEDGREIYL